MSAQGKRAATDRVAVLLREMKPREVVLQTIRDEYSLRDAMAEDIFRQGSDEFEHGGCSTAQMDYLIKKNVMEVLGSEAATPGTRMQAARLAKTLDPSGDDGGEYNVDDKLALWYDYIDQMVTIEQMDDFVERLNDPAFDIHAISPETVEAMAQKTGRNGNRPRRKAK